MTDMQDSSESKKSVATKSLPRVSRKLSENSQGKYIVHVGFTFAQVSEMKDALHKEITACIKIRKDDTLSGNDHADAGHREEILSEALKYIYEAFGVIKAATTARQQGRWEATHKVNGLQPSGPDTNKRSAKAQS